MIDHISIGSRRYAEATDFYRQVLAPLGLGLLRDTGKEAAFGTPQDWCFFIYPADAPVTAPGAHIAWRAGSHAQVEQVHAAALAAGGQDLFTPRPRPDISDSYFGAMFSDLDGHRIEVKTDTA